MEKNDSLSKIRLLLQNFCGYLFLRVWGKFEKFANMLYPQKFIPIRYSIARNVILSLMFQRKIFQRF